MSAYFACDAGCGTAGTNRADFLELGYARKKIYCPECAQSVTAYLRLIEQLHIEVAQAFEKRRAELQADWQERYKTGALPDQ